MDLLLALLIVAAEPKEQPEIQPASVIEETLIPEDLSEDADVYTPPTWDHQA